MLEVNYKNFIQIQLLNFVMQKLLLKKEVFLTA